MATREREAASVPATMLPMLASSGKHQFGLPGWIYEPKFDGFRALVFVRGGEVEIRSRRGLRMTHHYPALCRAVAEAVKHDCILDGELVAFNEQGHPCFDRMQQRMNLSSPLDIKRADANIPVSLFAFDLPHVGDRSLLRTPLLKRKAILQESVETNQHVQIMTHFDDGESVYQACVQLGFEGVMAKRANSHYEPGRRSLNWIKLKPYRSAEFVVAGYSLSSGGILGTVGSLVLGQYSSNGELIYKGSVGTGFSDRMLQEIAGLVKPLETKACPFRTKPADRRDAIWLIPHVVAQVKFMTWTTDGKLRIPVFERFRPDLSAGEIYEA